MTFGWPPRRLGAPLAALTVLSALATAACGSAVAARGEGVGFSGKAGDPIPLEPALRDDTGATVRLGELTERPLLLTFVPFPRELSGPNDLEERT